MFNELKNTLDIQIKNGEYPSKSGKATNSIINFSNLIVKQATGKTYKQIRFENGLKTNESIENYLSKDEVRKIGNIEDQVILLIKGGLNYKDIKNMNLITY